MFYINYIKIINNGELMEIKNLNTFLHVAEFGSFSRAGEELGYSQPTVSVQIRQLEQELGVRLFDRIGHAVRLTDQGRQILHYAQQVCKLCSQMTHESSQQVPTVVRLATADSLCAPLLLDHLSRLRQEHPHILVKVTTAGTGDLFRMLDRNEVDMVCTLDSHIYNTDYVIAAEERADLHFVVPVNHPLAKRKVLRKEDVLRQDLLLTEKNMSYRRLLDEWMAKSSMQVQPVLEIGSADLICRLVQQGMGMSFLPDYVTQAAVEEGSVVRLQAEGFAPELWKQLLYHRDKWLSPPLQSVIDHLKTAL